MGEASRASAGKVRGTRGAPLERRPTTAARCRASARSDDRRPHRHYDLYGLGNRYCASSSSFSYFGNQATRFVNGFGGLGTGQNRGNFSSNEFRSRLEVGRHFSSLPLLGGLPTPAGKGGFRYAW